LLGGPATFARDNATLNINVYNNNNNNYSKERRENDRVNVMHKLSFVRQSWRPRGENITNAANRNGEEKRWIRLETGKTVNCLPFNKSLKF